ncbi:HlyD family secretion protein [Oryzibacter oryziterrae]|uniref:HlyD family secretion protein n=1 Tax=Oryzibacter oryziterrae TaxID=2766474 RepID=UPI001F467DE7|nr:HlyD family secretion protein [Oryzibacter oryziterrae]
MSEVETPSPVPPQAAPAIAPAAAPAPPKSHSPEPSRRAKRRVWRLPVMLALPLAIAAAGGWYWVTGARWVSTENAYVQQNKVLISPEVSGRIAEVFVGQNQSVAPGTPLFRLDDASYAIDLKKADSAVALARLQVEQLRTAYKDAQLKAETARGTLEFQQTQFSRQERLRNSGNATEAQFDSARHDLDLARQAVAEADQSVADALAALGGDANIETDRHPSVLSALAAESSARLDLQHTLVTAPAKGTVSQVANLQVGQYVASGSPVMAIVDTQSVWIEANFKETDLEHMRTGQVAALTLDAYPSQPLKGKVESIGAGTGAIFSLLPAQNATGNWVKVVQRVPVRLSVSDAGSLPLRAGLSVSVDVDTGFVRPLPPVVNRLLTDVGLDHAVAAVTQP